MGKAWAELNLLAAEYGAEAFVNLESARRTMRGFKIANAPLGRRIRDAIDKIAALEKKRDGVPARIPVQQLTDGEVIKLRVERKHITDLLKMVAFQAESDLVRLISPHYRRAEDEGRTLIQAALASVGDIAPDGDEPGVEELPGSIAPGLPRLDVQSTPIQRFGPFAPCTNLSSTTYDVDQFGMGDSSAGCPDEIPDVSQGSGIRVNCVVGVDPNTGVGTSNLQTFLVYSRTQGAATSSATTSSTSSILPPSSEQMGEGLRQQLLRLSSPR